METFIIVLFAVVSLFFFYLSLRIMIDMRRHERKFKKDVSVLAAVFASSAFGIASLLQDVSIILAVIFSCILIICCIYRLHKLSKRKQQIEEAHKWSTFNAYDYEVNKVYFWFFGIYTPCIAGLLLLGFYI
ncbi:MAG: hypothetical protein Q4F75_09115 [Pseudomonadota bacterium]|nr:hypothetical protein [Pseudomonadota bacterium]